MDKEMSKEEMVKEAVEEAKKAAAETVIEPDAQSVEEAAEEAAQTEEAEDTEVSEELTEACEESEETSSDEESGTEAKSSKKEKLFGRKNKKDKKDEQIEDLTDRLKRQMAEFDNFRKRTEKEKSAMYEIGARDVIEKMLPIVDNFERGLAAVPEEEKKDPFVDGMDKIYKQILTTLEGIGVKPIEAVGTEFNPELHNAVMHVEDEELGENIIAEEFQKGYTYRDAVVRHSMVKVAN